MVDFLTNIHTAVQYKVRERSCTKPHSHAVREKKHPADLWAYCSSPPQIYLDAAGNCKSRPSMAKATVFVRFAGLLHCGNLCCMWTWANTATKTASVYSDSLSLKNSYISIHQHCTSIIPIMPSVCFLIQQVPLWHCKILQWLKHWRLNRPYPM